MIGTELLNLMYGNPLGQVSAAINPAPNPSPLAPPAAGVRPPAQAGGAPAPGGPPAASPGAPAPPPPNPQANLPPTAATQSPPDLAQLYMQLEQRNRSANEIDHGLALMASAYAAPGTQGQIMHSMDKDQPDPGTQLGNLIQLQYMQKMQGMPAPEGVPAAAWASSPPNVKMKLLEDAAQAGIQTQTKLTQDKQADFLEARQKAPAALQQMTQMDTIADQIKGAKGGRHPGAAEHPVESDQEGRGDVSPRAAPHKEGESGVIDQVKLQAAAAALSPEEQAAVNQIKQLDNQIYGEAFQVDRLAADAAGGQQPPRRHQHAKELQPVL